jgi:hypothetical protein
VYLPVQFLNVVFGRDVLSDPLSRVPITGLGRLKPEFSVADARAELMVHERRLGW